MPIILKSENVLDVGSDRVVDETSDERFDRAAFARRAIELVQPPRTTVAICEGAARMRVESGRVWGHRRARAPAIPVESARQSDAHETDERSDEASHERWALLAIPSRASRRAIALAVAQLGQETRPYALDVLMGEAGAGEASRSSPPIEPDPA
jgi:hypothetical protein